MGRIKEIYVECKKSRNFQTYTVGLTEVLDESDDPVTRTKYLQAKCRQLVLEQFKLDRT